MDKEQKTEKQDLSISKAKEKVLKLFLLCFSVGLDPATKIDLVIERMDRVAKRATIRSRSQELVQGCVESWVRRRREGTV
jgi:hypothetical protein